MALQEQIDNVHARRMGDLENSFAILQRQKLYKTFGVVGQFNRDIRSNKVLLARALRSILLKHPMLSATVVGTDYSDLTVVRPVHDYIRVLDQINLSDLLLDLPAEITNTKLWEEKCAKLNEIVLPYGEGHTLWKLAFLDDHTVAYISNHVLADGINGKHILQDLVEEFNSPSVDQLQGDFEDPILINYENDQTLIAKLPVPLQDLVDHTPSTFFLIKYFVTKILTKIICYQNPTPTASDNEFIYKLVNVSPEELNNLKKGLKEHSKGLEKSITLSAYIQLVWLNCLYDQFLSKNTYLGYSDFVLPCNTRQYLPSNSDEEQYRYSWSSSLLLGIYPPVKRLTWNQITNQHLYLREEFQKKTYLHIPGIITLKSIKERVNIDKLMIKRTSEERKGGTLFSNLGYLDQAIENDDNEKNEKFEVINAFFSQNLNSVAYSFTLNAVSTKQGGLNLIINMFKGTTSIEEFDSIIKEFKTRLLNYESIEEV